MEWSWRIGRIAGVEISIHALCILIPAALIWVQEPFSYPGIMHSALMSSLFVGALLLHEISHAYAARLCGITVQRVVVMPFGGMPKGDQPIEKPVHVILISIAGPLANFAAALGALIPAFQVIHLSSPSHPLVTERIPMLSLGVDALIAWAAINGLIGALNCIPVFPLDGGRILCGVVRWVAPRYERHAVIGSTVAIGAGFFGASVAHGDMLLGLLALSIMIIALRFRKAEDWRTL